MTAVKLTVVYYSSTGTVHRLARAVAEAAEGEGAEVRLRRVAELAPDDAVAAKPAWAEHLRATESVPEATIEDVDWADALAFGTPTRFGNVCSQLKQFIDTLGPLWFADRLSDKAYTAFTSGTSTHGGMETTLMSIYQMVHHFGGIVVPPGYSDPVKFVDGNPYGTSQVVGRDPGEVDLTTLKAAAVQGRRLVDVAQALVDHRSSRDEGSVGDEPLRRSA